MKTILYITTTVKDEGPGNLLGSLLCNIKREQYQPHVLTIQGGGKWAVPFIKRGIPVTNLGLKTPLDFFSLPLILYHIKKIKPDLIHTQLITADIFGRLAAEITGIKYATTVHNMDDWKRSRNPISWAAKHMDALQLKRAQGIVAVSRAVKLDIATRQRVRPTKITVIKNAVNFKCFANKISSQKKQAIRQDLNIPANALVVGTSARLARQKAPENWLATAKQIVKNYPRVHFVWAGRGPLYKKIENLVSVNNLATNIHLAGFRSDLPDLLQIFDIYVLVSRWEGLPLSLIEAMCAGIPSIASDVSGNPEVIRHNATGLLVPPDRPLAFAENLKQLITQPNLRVRLGLAGQDFVKKNFSLRRMIDEYELFYKKIFSGGKSN